MYIQKFENLLLGRFCRQDLAEFVCRSLIQTKLVGQGLYSSILLLTSSECTFQHLLDLDHGEAWWIPGFIQNVPHGLQVCPWLVSPVERLLQLTRDPFV